ncbi:MAG: hypothetical protein KJ749_02400 [Planctomycetes bacterium]|nr:hypothetical protein [Planctomycetota bacterium]
MTDVNQGVEQPRNPSSRVGEVVVFWLLVLMGFSAFASCIVLPEWRAYVALEVACQAEEHRRDAVQRDVERTQRLHRAMQSDPAVIDRLARRELTFRQAGEQTVLVALPASGDILESQSESDGLAEMPFVPRPIEPPIPIARLRALLPDYDYAQVFCSGETRPIIMGMSVGLLGIALWLFSPRRPA